MPNVAVVTDSCASIPETMVKDLNIHWAAYYIHRGSEVLRDLVTIHLDEFLKWLETATLLPKTASPGPGDYVQLYEELIQAGTTEIVSIHMTSKGSGAYQAAKVAQSMILEKYQHIRIEVIDSLNVSLCQGWMVIEAARLAIKGSSFNDVVAKVKSMIPKTHMIQTADTLKYLYLGGRIGRARHLLGTILNIKPLIGMVDGVIVPLGKAHGRMKAYEQMVEYIARSVQEHGKIKIAYVHAGARNEVEKIKEMVSKRFNSVETIVTELSPALAVHTGPGTAGFCFYPVD